MVPLQYRPAVASDAVECVELRGRTRENAVSASRLAALGITAESWGEDIRKGQLPGHLCIDDGQIVGYCFGDRRSGEIVVLAGTIYWTSEDAGLDEDLPDDLGSSDRYVQVPHKNDLGLGKSLALRFVAEALPDHTEQVDSFFRHKGAYARFKALLEEQGVLERWYNFESEATVRALREWCAEHGLEVS